MPRPEAPVRVDVERADGVLSIALAAPPVNALTVDFLGALEDTVDTARDPEIRAVVLHSAVDGIFVAGADLRFLRDGDPDDLRAYVRRIQDVTLALEALPAPVVVAVDGACLGGGLEIVLACDVRVASPRSSFGFPEAGLGILAAAGGTQRLTRAAGETVARDLLITGRRVDGTEAAELGLVSRTAPDGTTLDVAQEIAGRLTTSSPEAMAAAKRLALAAPDLQLRAGLSQELDAWAALRRGANAREGLTAFLERRAPRYTTPPRP